jgi:hypothetical protein
LPTKEQFWIITIAVVVRLFAVIENNQNQYDIFNWTGVTLIDNSSFRGD